MKMSNGPPSAQARAFKARQFEKLKRESEERKLRATQAAAKAAAEAKAKAAEAAGEAAAEPSPRVDGDGEPSES